MQAKTKGNILTRVHGFREAVDKTRVENEQMNTDFFLIIYSRLGRMEREEFFSASLPGKIHGIKGPRAP